MSEIGGQVQSVQAPAEACLRLRAYRLPILVGLLLLLQLIAPYRGWQIMLVGLGGAWLLSYLWARSLARGLHLTREMRFGWVQVGDRLLERFRLANQGWAAAAWVEVVDHSTLPDYQVSRATSVDGRGSIRWHTEAACTRRGLFMLGPTSLLTGDPFGLYQVTLRYPASLPLLVLPPIVPLPAIEIAPGGRAGEGRPRTNAFERTVSAASVREYLPGDSPRWIHWRTTARRDSPFVRLFDSTPAGDWWIVLDMDEGVQEGKGADATGEHAVILAASLAVRGLRTRRAVGLVAHGKDLVWLPPRDGEGQRWEMLRALALVSLGRCPLAELLAGMQPAFGRRASVVIITPSVDAAWVMALAPMMQRGIVPTVLWLDPRSFGRGGDTVTVQALLADLGVAHYVVERGLLDRPEARPGEQWRWGRQVSRPQRAALQGRPVDTTWQVVSP
jgi:uncharacterized protein (DUF58 family)